MVNVDELNEEIKKFGIVVEKMEELPRIYDDVKNQLEVCREALKELKMAKEDMERFTSSTTTVINERHREHMARFDELEKELNQKIDKAEVSLRDRVALLESNTTLALNEVKTNIEKSTQELDRKLDTAEAERKKWSIITALLIGVVIILEVIKFFV